jgi:hypothetical protein
MSIKDRQKFRDGVTKMTASCVWELQNHIQQRIPDPVDYIEMRRSTFGSHLTMSLARITYGARLPDEIFETRPMRGLENAAQDYACLLNDVFSYQKEIQFEGELHNGVLVVQNFLGVEPHQAVLVVCDLMISRMKQFEHIVATELPFVADSFDLDDAGRVTLDGWVTMMQDWMAGILDWHILTGRYDEQAQRRQYTPGGVHRRRPSRGPRRRPPRRRNRAVGLRRDRPGHLRGTPAGLDGRLAGDVSGTGAVKNVKLWSEAESLQLVPVVRPAWCQVNLVEVLS